ncbi:MAG: hypothetical protein ACI9VS_001007, partial [Candidatus Binatia bacterium]
ESQNGEGFSFQHAEISVLFRVNFSGHLIS